MRCATVGGRGLFKGRALWSSLGVVQGFAGVQILVMVREVC